MNSTEIPIMTRSVDMLNVIINDHQSSIGSIVPFPPNILNCKRAGSFLVNCSVPS